MATYKVTPNVIKGKYGPWKDGEPIKPPDVWHLAEGPDLPGRVWFRLARAESGKIECTELQIEADRPLTTSVLRSIPLSRIIDDCLRQPFGRDERGGPMSLESGLRMHYDWLDPVLSRLDDDEARNVYLINTRQPSVEAHDRPRRGGVGPSQSDLSKFREVYTWALEFERSRPIAATAEQMHISRATAHRWRALLESEEGENDGS